VTSGSTVVDWIEKNLLKGVGETHLWSIPLEICHQKCIKNWELEGMVEFEFKFVYKYGMPLHIRTLCFLRICIKIFHLALCQVQDCMSDLGWEERLS